MGMTERDLTSASNFHPGPGKYNTGISAMNQKFVTSELDSSIDPNLYYVAENGNVKEKP